MSATSTTPQSEPIPPLAAEEERSFFVRIKGWILFFLRIFGRER
jgi:hypothetical protein